MTIRRSYTVYTSPYVSYLPPPMMMTSCMMRVSWWCILLHLLYKAWQYTHMHTYAFDWYIILNIIAEKKHKRMYARVDPKGQQKKKNSNKHKKQLNKIDGWSRDGSTKKYMNKGSRDNKVHVTYLLVTCTLLSLLPLFIYFFVLPSLLHPSIYFLCLY